MVERFNRRIADALRQLPPAQRNRGKNKFLTHAERNAFPQSFVHEYNRTRLKCLGYTAPLQALDNPTEHYTQAGATIKWVHTRRYTELLFHKNL